MNDWKFANDKPDSIWVDPPQEAFRVASAKEYFAEGFVEAYLAKGGPAGAFLWVHLHGKHNDRYGETRYTLNATVTDESGYPYMVVPYMETVVEGVIDKPERHRHGLIIMMNPQGEQADWLKMAVDNGVKLTINLNGDRKRDDVAFVKGQLEKILKKAISDAMAEAYIRFMNSEILPLEMLKILQDGKKPSFIENEILIHS